MVRKIVYKSGEGIGYPDGRQFIVSHVIAGRVHLLCRDYPERGTFSVAKPYIRTGKFRCPLLPYRESSPAYRGVGEYDTNKHPEAYNRWSKMMKRCYEYSGLHNERNYGDCEVHEDWWNFQNYAEWYYKNLIKGCTHFHIDKDILFKGCKLYSENTCCIVPQEINTLFTKRENERGEYPIGIYYKKKNRKFCVQCSDGTKRKQQTYLGLYTDISEAFNVYKQFKEDVIKDVANRYKDVISKEVHQVLMDYEVQFTD